MTLGGQEGGALALTLPLALGCLSLVCVRWLLDQSIRLSVGDAPCRVHGEQTSLEDSA